MKTLSRSAGQGLFCRPGSLADIKALSECASDTKTTACPAGEPTHTYTYDKVGNRNTRAAAGVTTNYRYDAADRLLQTDTGSSITAYDYDVDGNQIKAGSTTFG
ncbi:hypothetical protein [Streptomyces sp. NPDC058272]|uniref:hypothetical protein n=1 Tax=Streptomyces sp. NPDC058272 TaxID=3346415 RepID=UPI0036EB00A2